MTTVLLVAFVGIVLLAALTAISLALLRILIRYHVESEGIRVTFLSFTLWYCRWTEVRSVKVVSGWKILRPTLTLRLGTKVFGPGVQIGGRHLGAVLTPSNPEEFAREVRQRARLE